MEEITALGLGGLVLLIPIIAILTHHQQKMAKLLRPEQLPPANLHETNLMRAEIQDLRQRIDSLTLSIEQMRDEQRAIRELDRRINI
jgi:hypothetical protein